MTSLSRRYSNCIRNMSYVLSCAQFLLTNTERKIENQNQNISERTWKFIFFTSTTTKCVKKKNQRQRKRLQQLNKWMKRWKTIKVNKSVFESTFFSFFSLSFGHDIKFPSIVRTNIENEIENLEQTWCSRRRRQKEGKKRNKWKEKREKHRLWMWRT